MINPNIDLELITTELQQIGFVSVAKLAFRRDFVEIEIKDGIIPDNFPKDMDLPTPFFRVKIYSVYNSRYAQFDCDILQMLIFVNSQA